MLRVSANYSVPVTKLQAISNCFKMLIRRVSYLTQIFSAVDLCDAAADVYTNIKYS